MWRFTDVHDVGFLRLICVYYWGIVAEDREPQTLAEALELLQERDNRLDRAAVDLEKARQDLDDARRAQTQASAVVQSSNDAIISMTPDCVMQAWNPGASRLLRYPEAQMVGEHIQALMQSNARDSFGEALQQIRSGYQPHPYETQWRRSNGTLVDVSVTVFQLRDAGGHIIGFTAVARDITLQLDFQRELQRLAQFDALTGLANRAQTLELLKAAITNARSPGPHLGLLFCDVDNFKKINDTLGHSVGDLVLTAVAERLRDCVRADDPVGRMGGDEMLVLLPGLHGIDEAVMIGEKVRKRAAEPIYHFEQTVHITLSVGATLAIPGESVSAMTARADAAMYQAKRAGSDQVCVI